VLFFSPGHMALKNQGTIEAGFGAPQRTSRPGHRRPGLFAGPKSLANNWQDRKNRHGTARAMFGAIGVEHHAR